MGTPKIRSLLGRNTPSRICYEIPSIPNVIKIYLWGNSSNPSLAPPTAAEEYCAIAAFGEANMKKEDARLAVLREHDRWAKDHPKKERLDPL